MISEHQGLSVLSVDFPCTQEAAEQGHQQLGRFVYATRHLPCILPGRV